jgi:hypothetical protein
LLTTIAANLRNALNNFNSFFKKEDEEEEQPTVFEIGLPSNVTHEGHIGFDKNEGFKVRSKRSENN